MNTPQDIYIPSKRTIWTIRLVLLGLFGIWLAGTIYLHQEIKESRAKVEQKRMEAQRREERVRRGAQYQQAVQERSRKPQSRNALDNL